MMTTPNKHLRRVAAMAAATAAITFLSTGCGTDDPSPAASAAPPSVSAASANGTAADVDVPALLDEAGKSARILRSVKVGFSTTGIPDLLAQSYAADVTTAPAVATKGTANLKINGKYAQTDFKTVNGNLWIKGTDGKFSDLGTARGKFDPAVLLDPERGIAALVTGTTDARVDGAPAKVKNRDVVKVTGELPAANAAVLVPKEALAGSEKLPITLFLSPEQPRMLVQAIIKVGNGSMTVDFDKGEPFTTTAG